MISTFMGIGTEVTFVASHSLPGYEGKCSALHGHTWRVVVRYEGIDMSEYPIPDSGMLIDFVQIKDRIMYVFDHKCLNDFMVMPTAENIAMRILSMMPVIDNCNYVLCVTVYESAVSYIEVVRIFDLEVHDD